MHLRFTLRSSSSVRRGYYLYFSKILALSAIYFIAARFGLTFAALNRFATLIWFPSGIAMATLLLFGRRLWPGVFLAAFLANYMHGAPLLVAIGIGIGNTLEALAGTYLLQHYGFHSTLDHLRDVLLLAFLAVPISTIISASLGVSSLLLGNIIAISAYYPTWLVWWTGDMLSILLLTPLILIWGKWTPGLVSAKRLVEMGALGAYVLVVCLIIYLRILHPEIYAATQAHLVFLPLIWAALRFGPRGAISAVFVISISTIIGNIQYFIDTPPSSLSMNLFPVQSFTATIAITTMILAAVMAERTELARRNQERILVQARSDTITTLLNHRALITRLDQELERSRQYNSVCSLLFLDLDHFKALNDGYGHAIGDAVLGEFADLVQAQLRRMDIMGRWGGEEFVAILPELQTEEALLLAESIQSTVSRHIFHVGGGIHLTCSIGMASYPIHAQEREGLLRIADQAMYGAKHFGRDQVRVADDPEVLALLTTCIEGREKAALVSTTEALVTLVEVRDSSTGNHSHQVADLAFQLAMALGLSAAEAQMMALAGQLHDVGKLVIPDGVLQKPGALTDDEWDLMKTHTEIGADVINRIPALRPLSAVIRAHHERWDGHGYPDHLMGEMIPLGARILAVVDAYHAMTMHRPYQQAREPSVALVELCRGAGSQFDPQVVDVFRRIMLNV